MPYWKLILSSFMFIEKDFTDKFFDNFSHLLADREVLQSFYTTP